MKTKKIISATLSLLLALGSFTVLPDSVPLSQSIQADATDYMLFDKNYFDGSIVPNIENLTVNFDGTTAKLSWKSVRGASVYTVMYATSGSTLLNTFDSVTSNTCTITGLDKSKSYFFAVSAMDNNVLLASAYTEDVTTKAASSSASKGDFVIKKDSDGLEYIAEYKGKGGDVVLPDDYYIGENAFKGNTTITSITSNSGRFFGNYSFEDCINLKKVIIKGDAFFGAASFSGCINLEKVTVEGSLCNIFGQAFAFCQSLNSFTVKENESEFYIGTSAFSNCYSLKSFVIPDKCTEIYNGAFVDCFNLEKITVPANTKFNYKYGKNQMGFFEAAKTENDAWDDIFYTDVADGKTTVYCGYYNTKTGVELENGLLFDFKQFTPKKLTMYVTKGSDAEKYAKENKVAYEYVSSASSKLPAPKNLKATKKTANSITITWSAVDGADKYIVYLLNTETGKYEKYSTVKSAKCTIKKLKKGTSYKVKVVAVQNVNGKSKKGSSSKPITVKTSSK